jgi:hypothetical protein
MSEPTTAVIGRDPWPVTRNSATWCCSATTGGTGGYRNHVRNYLIPRVGPSGSLRRPPPRRHRNRDLPSAVSPGLRAHLPVAAR